MNSTHTPSTSVMDRLKHYRKSQMTSVLKSLLNSPQNRPQTNQQPFTKLHSFSQRVSPLQKDLSAFERTQDQTLFKNLDFSHLPEFEFRNANLTPHSPINSQMSRDFKLTPFISTHRYNKNDKRYNIILFFEENSLLFQDYLRRKDGEKLIQLFRTPMYLAQLESLPDIFSELLYFLASFLTDCGEFTKASFFLKECFILSNLTRNSKLKVKVLLTLSQCAKQFKLFDQQLLLIQKALMYSWAYDYHDEEIQCYDAMGLAYYYQGNIDKAEYYHEKWSNGYLEIPKSYYRLTAIEFIQMFERTLPTKATDFMSSIQGAIGVPFINILTQKNYDEKRFIKYNNCDPRETITSITDQREFKEFNLIHHEQSQQFNSQPKRNPKLPKRILEITEKYHRNKDLYEFDHKIFDNPRYKLTLQQQVNHRIKQSFSLEKMNQSVRKFISTQREPYLKAQKIYMRANHLQKEFLPAFIARYKKMLLQILK